MKVQEKRYMERVKSDLKILKDVSCSVELVGESKGKKIRKSVYVKAFCILDNKIVVGFDVKKVQLRRTQLTTETSDEETQTEESADLLWHHQSPLDNSQQISELRALKVKTNLTF